MKRRVAVAAVLSVDPTDVTNTVFFRRTHSSRFREVYYENDFQRLKIIIMIYSTMGAAFSVVVQVGSTYAIHKGISRWPLNIHVIIARARVCVCGFIYFSVII